MLSGQFDRPVIAFYTNRYRIRIFRSTLKALGLPNYIQLLVNPQDGLLAIKGFQEKPRHQFHRVNYKQLIPKNSLDIHSHYLVHQLKNVCEDVPETKYYRIEGKSYPKERIAVFRLADAVVSDEEVENAP